MTGAPLILSIASLGVQHGHKLTLGGVLSGVAGLGFAARAAVPNVNDAHSKVAITNILFMLNLLGI